MGRDSPFVAPEAPSSLGLVCLTLWCVLSFQDKPGPQSVRQSKGGHRGGGRLQWAPSSRLASGLLPSCACGHWMSSCEGHWVSCWLVGFCI